MTKDTDGPSEALLLTYDELLIYFEEILSLAQSLQIIAVAPEYGAGELLPEHLQRIANIIGARCNSAISKIHGFPDLTL